MAGLHGLYNVNVAGLENSTAGISSAAGVINGTFIQKAEIYCTSAQHEGQVLRRRPSTDRSRGQLQVYPTTTALRKAIETFQSQAVIALVGNLGEGEPYIIKQLPSEYEVQHLNDINEFTEQFERLEREKFGKVAYVIWKIPDFIIAKEKLGEIFNSIISKPSASKADRKYIFICQPWSLKMFKNNMRREFFNEINTVLLTGINGHPNQWKERLQLLEKFKCQELPKETKERIAKVVPPVGGFPYLCAMYNGEGAEFFEKPHEFARQQFEGIVSSNGLIHVAPFVLMVACKGKFKENDLRRGSLHKECDLVNDVVMNVTPDFLLKQLEYWKGSILKFEGGVWYFSNAVWDKQCTMVLYEMYDTLFEFCRTPCARNWLQTMLDFLIDLFSRISRLAIGG